MAVAEELEHGNGVSELSRPAARHATYHAIELGTAIFSVLASLVPS
jgi:hypothetical protein